MKIPTNSAPYGFGPAQRALTSLLQPAAEGDRQEKPGKAKAASGPPPAPAPAEAAKQFAGETLGSLLAAQESSRSDSLAKNLIKHVDADEDGALSLEEIQTTLGARAPENLAATVAGLDTDANSKLSADELSAALEANRPGRGPPPRPASADVASRLIGDVDSDSDGALSLAEITSKLGLGEDSDLTAAFGKLDTDGNGLIGAAELTAALDAFRAKHGRGEPTTQAAA